MINRLGFLGDNLPPFSEPPVNTGAAVKTVLKITERVFQ
jgi:hypothetical protein